VPGGKTIVNAEVKTKSGESTKGIFQEAQAISGAGTVTPAGGTTPLQFTFTAPTKKMDRAGFKVAATSRAGVAMADWYAGLGTDWSGRISYTVTNSGDQGANELQTWSNSSVQRLSIDVRNGKATVTGFTEVHYMGVRRQPALRGGVKTIIFESSDTTEGSYEETVDNAEIDVVNPTPGTYSVRVGYAFKGEGKSRTEMCSRQRPACTTTEQLLAMPTLPGVDGRTDDPNRLSGTKTDTKTGTGYQGKGTLTTILTWELSREGTTR